MIVVTDAEQFKPRSLLARKLPGSEAVSRDRKLSTYGGYSSAIVTAVQRYRN